MRKLLAALLFLPFLLGANVPAAAPTDAARETLSTITQPLAQPPLGAHLTGAAAASALADRGPADSSRTPERTHRTSAAHDPRSYASEIRVRIARLRRSHLEFGRALARARANFPATLGNPPPPSPT